jgi:hypothetical protein
MTTPADPRGLRRLRGRPGPRELALFAGIYLLYDGARWMFKGSLPVARRHAHWVIRLERHLHIAVESSVQHAFSFGVAEFGLAEVYLVAQLLALPTVLIWTYFRHRDVYRPLRNTIAALWLSSIPIFALYPVAPPRLAGIGIHGTVGHQAGVALTGHSTIFYNPYAAVPSLHVGIAFAIGTAIAATRHHRWAQAVAFSWGPLVTLAVIATGNHFVFDAATGLLLTTLAYAATNLLAPRWRQAVRHHPRPQSRLVPHPVRSCSLP